MRRTAQATLAVTVVFAGLSGVFFLLAPNAPVPDAWGFRGSNALLGIVFGWAGYVVASRRPRNSIGWLLALVGIANAVDAAVVEYASLALYGGGGWGRGELAAWAHD